MSPIPKTGTFNASHNVPQKSLIRWDLEQSPRPFPVELPIAERWEDQVVEIDGKPGDTENCWGAMARALSADGLIDTNERAFEFAERFGVTRQNVDAQAFDGPRIIVGRLIKDLRHDMTPREFRERALAVLAKGEFTHASGAASPSALVGFDTARFLEDLRQIPTWTPRRSRVEHPNRSDDVLIDAFQAALSDAAAIDEVALTLTSLAFDGTPHQGERYRTVPKPNDNIARMHYFPYKENPDHDEPMGLLFDWADTLHNDLRRCFATPALAADAIEKSLARMRTNAAVAFAEAGTTPRGFSTVDRCPLDGIASSADLIGAPRIVATAATTTSAGSDGVASQLAARFGGTWS